METFHAGLYFRLSREDGDKTESDSIGSQRKVTRDYAGRHPEIILVSEYADDGYSGTNFKRPQFLSMKGDIESGRLNCVIVKEYSRFGRDRVECDYYLKKYFPRNKIRFISVEDGYDSLTAREDDILMPIKGIFHEQYARDISKKVRSGLKVRKEEGLFIGAFPSYGYEKDPLNRNRLVLDAYASEVVKKIYHWFVSGMSKQQIANHLNEAHILPPAAYKELSSPGYRCGRSIGAKYGWSYNAVHEILKREMYTGTMVQHTVETEGIRGRQVKRSPQEFIRVEGAHPPIIDRNIWDKAQKLQGRKAICISTGKREESPLGGRVRCGDCGRSMVRYCGYTNKNGEKKYYFTCSSYRRYGKSICSRHTISCRFLENVILSDVNKLLSQMGCLKELIRLEGERACKRKRPGDPEALKQELEKQKEKQWQLYEDYRDGLLTKEDYLHFREKSMEQQQLLQQKMEACLSEWESCQEKEKISPWLVRFKESACFQKLDREMALELINEIRVYEDKKVEIEYRFKEIAP